MAFQSFLFHDRRDAGRILAGRLHGIEIEAPVIVALPRGGVPVAYEVARALGVPMDVSLVRKLGAPGKPELGIGAIGEDGTVVIDEEAIASGVASHEQIERIVAREAAELERRRRLYRGDLSGLDVTDRTVIVIDDGIATGVTVVAATRVLRARGARRIVVAVPVCSLSANDRLRGDLDELICLERPARFGGVGAWYEDFSQTADREVISLLRASRSPRRELDHRR